MKMTTIKMKRMLEERLSQHDWKCMYNRDKDELRVEQSTTGKGITISLPGIVSKWEERKEAAIDEVVYHVQEALKVMNEHQKLEGKEKMIFPVIRSTSYPTETKDGKRLVYEDHTAETRIFFAIDLGKTYRLIDQDFIKAEGWEQERIKQIARFNIRSLDSTIKADKVAGNTFYFVNKNDGYDASRILNESLLEKVKKDITGTMAVAIPHQDVLIFADIHNDQGYDILAQMAMSFFAEGRIPITALSFLYEDGELDPIFILPQTKKD